MDRRSFVKTVGGSAGAFVLGGEGAAAPRTADGILTDQAGRTLSADGIIVDPEPLFEISPYLYMQFMEPLGSTDGSVEASWDYDRNDWRADLVEATRDLAPDVIRWGGLFIRYYKWREGVGPTSARPLMYNHNWGGRETNRVGTHEIVDFARRVGAEPMMCVNFLSDGFRNFSNTVHGENRTGDALEAAEWVSYANDPQNAERLRNGVRDPYGIKLWQLGNETSYGTGGFSRDEAITRTIEFARAMRERDPSIQLIGWGDRPQGGQAGNQSTEYWAPAMLERAGEHLNYVAVHMMGMSPIRPDTLLRGFEYQKDPARAWEELLELTNVVEERLRTLTQMVDAYAPSKGLAITEGHVSFNPHNANPILQEWLSAVYHARTMNLYLRNGSTVKICTGADFAGTRWTVNAVQIPMPRGRSFLLPVASIMRLFKRHKGTHGIQLVGTPAYLDVTASRAGQKVYLHVLNTSFSETVRTPIQVQGLQVTGGRIYEIAPETARMYVDRNNPDVFTPVEKTLPIAGGATWSFPPTSVTVVELDVV